MTTCAGFYGEGPCPHCPPEGAVYARVGDSWVWVLPADREAVSA